MQKLYLRYSQSITHLPLKFQSTYLGVFEHEWDIDEIHNQLKCPQVATVDFSSTEEVNRFPGGSTVVKSCCSPFSMVVFQSPDGGLTNSCMGCSSASSSV